MRSQECRMKLQWVIDNCENLDRRAIEDIKRASDFCDEHGDLSPLSTRAIMPLIREQDAEVRDKVIEKISDALNGKQHAGRGHTKKPPTEKQVSKIIKETKREKYLGTADKIEGISIKQSQKPTVNNGEWWRLGRHTLFCGDTGGREFVSSVPDAMFAFADPPYNAGAAEWDNNFSWQHDWLADKAGVVAVTPGIEGLFDFARITQMPYKWAISCWIDNGMTRGAMGFGNWIYVAVFSSESVHRGTQDVIRVSIKTSESSDTTHKGRKPAMLLIRLLDTFTNDGDIVIDPFLGSGTTLLIAEDTGRVCYGGEIDPVFCSDIISRWEQVTGEKAELIKDANTI